MENLPKDIAMMIFSLLDVTSFRSLSLICRSFQNIAREDKFAEVFHCRKFIVRFLDGSKEEYFMKLEMPLHALLEAVLDTLGLSPPLVQYKLEIEKEEKSLKRIDLDERASDFCDGSVFLFTQKLFSTSNTPEKEKGLNLLLQIALKCWEEENDNPEVDIVSLSALRAQILHGDYVLSDGSKESSQLTSVQKDDLLPPYLRSIFILKKKPLQRGIFTYWEGLKGISRDAAVNRFIVVAMDAFHFGSASFKVKDTRSRKCRLLVSPGSFRLTERKSKKLLFAYLISDLIRVSLRNTSSDSPKFLVLDFGEYEQYQLFSDDNQAEEIFQLIEENKMIHEQLR